MSERQSSGERRRWLLTAFLILAVGVAYVWVDPLIAGGPPRPHTVGQWVVRVAAVLAFYGGMVWLANLPKRWLQRQDPQSLIPSSKRRDHDRAV